jgi:hypothetical protein
MRTLRRAGVALALLALAACAGVRVNVDYDPGEDFSTYSTFTWLPAAQGSGADYRTESPLIDARIRAAIERTLTAKGYRKVVDGSPDFYVAHYLSIEKKIDVYTVNRGYVDYWGYGISWPETRARKYEEGTLVVDIADAREAELVWRGAAIGRVRRRPTPEKTTQDVNEAVEQILARFPPESK